TAPRARVGAGPLSAHRHATAMAQAPVAADVHQALDIHLHFAAQVTFDQMVALDDFAKTRHFGFGEIPNTGGRLDSDLLEHLRALGRTNSIDVGQTNVDRLVAWYVYAGDTSHSYPSPVLIRLALALLVLGINANNADHSAPLDDLATLTAMLDRRRNLHVSSRSL